MSCGDQLSHSIVFKANSGPLVRRGLCLLVVGAVTTTVGVIWSGRAVRAYSHPSDVVGLVASPDDNAYFWSLLVIWLGLLIAAWGFAGLAAVRDRCELRIDQVGLTIKTRSWAGRPVLGILAYLGAGIGLVVASFRLANVTYCDNTKSYYDCGIDDAQVDAVNTVSLLFLAFALAWLLLVIIFAIGRAYIGPNRWAASLRPERPGTTDLVDGQGWRERVYPWDGLSDVRLARVFWLPRTVPVMTLLVTLLGQRRAVRVLCPGRYGIKLGTVRDALLRYAPTRDSADATGPQSPS
jgi:hypothetical protein